MEQYNINFNSLQWESPLPGLKFKAYKYKNKLLRVVEYSNDFREPEWCIKSHTGYVIEGEFEIDFNGKIIKYSKGDGIFIPGGDEYKHKANILSKKVIVFLSDDI
jgi:glyoxylate utilization-related uncharacterized protein